MVWPTFFTTRLRGWLPALMLLAAGFRLPALDPDRTIDQYIHDSWQVDEGLPYGGVLAIVQTPDGYLWLGTEEGLVRFDGVHFDVFSSDNTPQMKNNYISSLLVDRSGNLWAGTLGGGLLRFRDGQFTCFTKNQGLSEDYVLPLFEDRRGDLWVGTSFGLNRFRDGRFVSYFRTDGLADDVVSAICEDRHGDLWIGTGKGLNRMRGDEFALFTTRSGLSHDTIRTIHEDRQGDLWIGTDGGLTRIHDGRFSSFTSGQGLLHESVLSIFQDRQLNLWIGTGAGLNCLREGRILTCRDREGIGHEMIWSIFEDREENLWIGSGWGLNRLKNGKFVTVTRSQGLADDYVLPICGDRRGRIWIGTRRGLNCLANGRVTLFSTRHGLADDVIISLWVDRQGMVWAGTGKGLSRQVSEHRFITYTIADGLGDNDIRAIYQDRNGDMWAGTGKGVSRFRHGRFVSFGKKQGMTDDHVLAIVEDRRGDVWLGTRGYGLKRFRNGEFDTFTSADGLASDFVLAIHEDRSGNLWIATSSGLNRLSAAGRWTTYSRRDGLGDDGVLAILEDNRGFLWLSCEKGIFRISLQELDDFASGRIRFIHSLFFDKIDGMITSRCNGFTQPAAWRGQDGRLWFPTPRGAVVIDPGRLQLNRQPPPVFIQKVRVDGRELPIAPGPPARLAPGRKKIEFFFTALSFVAPQRVRFRCRLEGFDADWVELGMQRNAYYTNIPGGEYRFQVLACNNDGFWSSTAAEFRFYLQPFFYQRWWFVTLAGIFFAFASYLLIHWLRNYLKFIAFWKRQNYVGHYKILSIIGSGGMGTVYKAQDMLDKKRIIALKVLKVENFSSEIQRKRFVNEAAVIDQLSHPHVVHIIERGQVGDSLYIAMEFLDGITLAQRIKQEKRLEIDAAVHIMSQIIDVLTRLHSRHIVHRDVKSENIMLLRQGEGADYVKLLDFGLAITQNQSRLTESGIIVGTLHYLPPERVASGVSSRQGDIYSAGIIFYEMLTGAKPFPGDTTVDVFRQILDAYPRPPREWRPEIPGELADLVMKMIAKKPETRPDARFIGIRLAAIVKHLRRSQRESSAG